MASFKRLLLNAPARVYRTVTRRFNGEPVEWDVHSYFPMPPAQLADMQQCLAVIALSWDGVQTVLKRARRVYADTSSEGR